MGIAMGELGHIEAEAEPVPTPLRRKRVITIRMAKLDDVDDIVALMRLAHAESNRELPPVDPLFARRKGLDVIAHGMTWVALDDEAVIGVLLCAVVSFTWNPGPCAIENQHFYVARPYRRFGVAEQLIGKLRATCDRLGLPARLCIDYGDGRAELKDLFVERCGFEYVGSNFIYAPSPGASKLIEHGASGA